MILYLGILLIGGKKLSLVNLVIAVSSFALRGLSYFCCMIHTLSSIYWLAGHLVTRFLLRDFLSQTPFLALGGQL